MEWTLMKDISKDALPQLGTYCFIAYMNEIKELVVPDILYRLEKSLPWSEDYIFVSVEVEDEDVEFGDGFFRWVNIKDVVAFCEIKKPETTENVIEEWEK